MSEGIDPYCYFCQRALCEDSVGEDFCPGCLLNKEEIDLQVIDLIKEFIKRNTGCKVTVEINKD